ncbi:N-acetylmuramoyl-L-alanine amidase, partial [Dorea formicigenerans]|uniref:N-acetylmuramoyl-L-alanine amidase n=1 Tax=Dorea formicigenerans TaxID=39486 RepID=UPI001EDD7121
GVMVKYSVGKGAFLAADGKPVTRKLSPNVGGRLKPQILVMHYTATMSAAGAIGWLCDRRAKASAHLVIDETGAVTQLVPFDVVA